MKYLIWVFIACSITAFAQDNIQSVLFPGNLGATFALDHARILKLPDSDSGKQSYMSIRSSLELFLQTKKRTKCQPQGEGLFWLSGSQNLINRVVSSLKQQGFSVEVTPQTSNTPYKRAYLWFRANPKPIGVHVVEPISDKDIGSIVWCITQ